MNIPNMLTSIRIMLVPIYLLVFFSDMENKLYLALAIFILAGITDFLDGYIARKYDLITKLGKALDPLADKLMMFAVLISLALSKMIPMWIVTILFVKEVLMVLGGGILYLFKGNQVVASNFYGKIATVFFYIATLVTVIEPDSSRSRTLFSLTVILNIVAFINYLVIYLKIDDNLRR